MCSERFYRVEPSMQMTKPQFITAMRRCFGDSILKTEASFGKLFESFDFDRTGTIDWRAMLYMLLILMQADMTYADHLKWTFCLYSSEGILDLLTPSPLSLGTVKKFICVPVLPVQKKTIHDLLDTCWSQLAEKHEEVKELTKESMGAGLPGGADRILVSYTHFQQLLTDTQLAVYCQQYDKPWTFVMEEEFFHPILCTYLRALRKAFRDERECERFLLFKKLRVKKYAFVNWIAYIGRRNLIRWRFSSWYLNWKLGFQSRAFDHWKKCTLEDCFGGHMQRCVRGLLGRTRKNLTQRLVQLATLAQAGGRQAMTRMHYKQASARNNWAATMIQKLYRGRLGRIRVNGIVISYCDTGRRLMKRDGDNWQYNRENRAVWRITMCYRKHALKRRIQGRLDMKERIEAMARSMDATVNQAKIKKEVYRQNLSKFYADRKATYDAKLMSDAQSKEERNKLIARRRQKKDQGKKEVNINDI